VIHNFLSNVIKHTDERFITLQLKTEEGKFFTISVTDTGTGIAEDKLPFVFERFEKPDNFTKGSGLGLAISKSLMEYLGGEIMLTSVLGEGSAFSFRIPLRRSMEEAVKADPFPFDEPENPEGPVNKKKILAIGYNDLDFNPIHTVLSRGSLIRTTNEEDALNKFLSCSPELLIIDISNPNFNGLGFIKRIRNLSLNMQLIAFSEYGNYTGQKKTLKSGCNDIVLKPYTASRLKDAIISYI
jgi:CheY-like chemotaxis protein